MEMTNEAAILCLKGIKQYGRGIRRWEKQVNKIQMKFVGKRIEKQDIQIVTIVSIGTSVKETLMG